MKKIIQNEFKIVKSDYSPSISRRNSSKILKNFLLQFLFLMFFAGSTVQTFAGVGAEKGSPSGSYPLSGFDNVNLFSGTLNFNLPVLSVKGRGGSGSNISLNMQRQWSEWQYVYNRTISLTSDPQNPNSPGNNVYCQAYQYWLNPNSQSMYSASCTGYNSSSQVYLYSQIIHNPIPDRSLNPVKPGYGPGILKGNTRIYALQDCLSGEGENISHTFGSLWKSKAYLTFIEPDGTEQEFVDQPTRGAMHVSPSGLCSAPQHSRGTVWVSTADSGVTFISDAPLPEWMGTFDGYGNELFYGPSGYLLKKDGTRYRIENGLVSWISDRNGNRTTYAYDGSKRVTTITDSVGHQVSINYDVDDQTMSPAGTAYGLCDQISFQGFGGAQRMIRITKTDLSNALRVGYSLQTTQQLWEGFTDYGNHLQPFNTQIVSGVWMPDGRSYKFLYNSFAELARVELPTGGAVEYDHDYALNIVLSGNTVIHVDEQGGFLRRMVEKREYTDKNDPNSLTLKTTFGKIASYGSEQNAPQPVDVEQKDKDNNLLAKTRHYFIGHPLYMVPIGNTGISLPPWDNGKEVKTESFAADGQTVLRRSERTFQPRVPAQDATAEALDINMVEEKSTLVDSNQVSKTSLTYGDFNNPTDTYEYDFGNGAPGDFKRRSHTDYVTNTSYTSETGAHLRALPSQMWMSSDEAGNNKVSLTQMEYDNYAVDTNHAALVDRANVSGHDTTGFGAGHPWRGNATAVTSYANGAAQSDSVTAFSQYDILGNVVKAIDAKGNASTISYSDNFGTPDAEARANSAPSQLNGQSTFAFATSATNPQGWTTYAQFDYFTGAGVDGEDINGVVSSSFYNDPLDRPTQSIIANNISSLKQQTSIAYDDTNRKVTITSDLNTFGDNSIKSESFYDGLGRTFEARKYETGGGYIATMSEYDALGRVKRVTNPYRPQQSEPQLWTISQYDALGRVTSVTTPDNATMQTAYSGNAVTVTDQAGKQRRSITNAVGQLTRVDEPDDAGNLGSISSPNQATSYAYDTLNNLTTVNQGVQTRTFSYDSLSRLKQAINPESGTISYSYDANGNLTGKTDARSISTTYAYDSLNRVTQRIYSDGTPQVTYTYDDPGIQFAKGMLTKVSSSVSETKYNSFDNLGKVLTSQQITNGQTYSFGYQYNLGGMLTEETYPSGRKVKNTIDTDVSLSTVETQTSGGSYQVRAENFTYTAAGAVSAMKLGNNKWENAQFNSRLQPVQLGLGTSAADQSLWKINYEYATNTNGTDNNGNVIKQTITTPGISPLVQTYTYDHLNRINGAIETQNSSETWKQTFGYDRYGNRNFDNTQTTTLGSCPAAQCNPAVDQSNNRFTTAQGYTYDLSGNLITDAQNRSFTYDAENKQKEVKDASNTSLGTYFYDGDGKRVKKVSASDTTVFVYDAAGQVVAEYVLTSATPQTPTTSYLTSDTLGSPRVITDNAGNVTRRRDFMPFGEEIANLGSRTSSIGYQTDSTRQKFTGYERDNESALDFAQARYYNSMNGRFTSIDPSRKSIRLDNPQTWNRYNYCLNNPLKFIDDNGKWPTGTHNKIIARAFDVMSRKDIYAIQKGSERTDRDGPIIRTMHPNRAPEHAMTPASAIREKGSLEKAKEWAKEESKEFIRDKLGEAKGALRLAKSGRIDLNRSPGELMESSLGSFGEAMHPVMDNNSPTHRDFQVFEYDFTFSIGGLLITQAMHAYGESREPTEAEMNLMIDEMRVAYQETYGQEAYEKNVSEGERKATADRIAQRGSEGMLIK